MESGDLYDQMAAASAQSASGEVAEMLASAPAVILYGAGHAGRDVLRILLERGITVRCFLDRSATPGDERAGIPVYLPDDPACTADIRGSVPVIITVFNYQVDEGALRAELHRLGWAKVVSFVAFHRDFSTALGSRYWLTDLSFYRGRAPQLRAAAALWADPRSRAIYDAILRYRARGEAEPILAPDADAPYFPHDVPPWTTPARFVDCGAYEGDTLAQIRTLGFPLAAVAAFEPDAGHLPKLSATLRALAASAEATPAYLWPCAVHSQTMQLRFAAGLGTSSGVSSQGEAIVPAVALDDVLAGFAPTFIKMDIEGSEYDALLGAREIIRRHRPGLAICVYHRAQHLWQIPLLIESWKLGYRFWLRIHARSGYELVLYAQPSPA
jgi:FkbM family methyltransferase